jgi:16S rRNA (cytidine1402-2'-O)-methyltransferase
MTRIEAGGTLFLVGTPIGNLKDITLRAIETLKSVDFVAAEDTRRSRALLSHLQIEKKELVSLDQNASPRKLSAVVERIVAGENMAFVTDAGMPGVSDPGTALVREAVKTGTRVEVIPGPSAVTTAVALSGLVESAYQFLGFLPRQGTKRASAIAGIVNQVAPVVLFESPNRVARTLSDLAERMPDRSAAVCRELTKVHEEAVRGTLRELADTDREWRGEVCIVLGEGTPPNESESDEALERRIEECVLAGGSTRDIVAELSETSSLSRRELYQRVERVRDAGRE